MKIGIKKPSLLAAKKSTETIELYDAISKGRSELFDLGSGCLAWQTKQQERVNLLYDPSRVVVEFFSGGGSTIYGSDTEHVHRMVVDSAFSKVQMKRDHISPYYSSRYALEWHGKSEPMEVPFPLYIDHMCVVGRIQPNGSIELLQERSPVPQLEKTSNIADIVFVRSTLEPRTDKGLEAFLSELVPKDRLTELIDRMSLAYALRIEKGAERPYEGLKLYRH